MSKFQFVESDDGFCIPPPRDPGSKLFIYWYREHVNEWEEQFVDERHSVLKKHAEKLWAEIPEEEKQKIQVDFEHATFKYTEELRKWLGRYQAQAVERKQNQTHSYEDYVPDEHGVQKQSFDIDLSKDSDEENHQGDEQRKQNAASTAAETGAPPHSGTGAHPPQAQQVSAPAAPGVPCQVQNDLIQMYREAEIIKDDEGVGEMMDIGEAETLTLQQMEDLKNSIMECANPLDD